MEKITLMPFDLPGKIFRSIMPFGKYDPQGVVLQHYLQEKITAVMILSEKKEWPQISGKNLDEIYQNSQIAVYHFPIADYSIPGLSGFKNALDTVCTIAKTGQNIAVHCQAGIGRTGLFMAFLAQQIRKIPPQEAILWVREVIPGAIETEEQVKFIQIKSGQILST